KLEANKMTIEARPFSLVEVIQRIHKSLQPRAQAKGLILQLDQSKRIPDTLIGDQTRLSQILINLLNNAIKFTEKGRIVLQIKILHQTAEDIKLHFIIQDTGIGISPEKQALIFESFSQVDDGTTRAHGGTGLGLAITKRLLELQGSTIQLESQVQKGSKFSFDLAFPIAQQMESKRSLSNSVLRDAAIPNLGKVLVVEDNIFNIKVLEKMFARWKVEMDLAENGQEALEQIKKNEYSMVLMDLQMPVMDGYRTTEIIRSWPESKYQQLPIIALSASAMEEFRERAFAAGMNDYITKPFVPKELFQTIERYASLGP
ncbi:MAG: response regulator, partial [Bacteroidota bacterium]